MTVIWTGERYRQQGRLVAGMYQAAAGVPCERSAVIAGGLPGADTVSYTHLTLPTTPYV